MRSASLRCAANLPFPRAGKGGFFLLRCFIAPLVRDARSRIDAFARINLRVVMVFRPLSERR